MNREPLDVFLYKFHRNEKWARLFTFAMTALGLFVVLGLVGLTTWGFASYDSARSRLSDTSQQLEVSEKKIGELELIANSNTSKAELMKLRGELSNSQQLVAAKDLEIAELREEKKNNSSPAPGVPSAVPQDCSKYQTTIDRQTTEIQQLKNRNDALNESLNSCTALVKRCRPKRPGSSTVDKPGVIP